MTITNEVLLAYTLVKGVGIKTVFKIADYIEHQHIELSSPNDMFDAFQMLLAKKIISRAKIESVNDINCALESAKRILETSERNDIHLTTYYDKEFPSKLRNIKDTKGKNNAPLMLWYKGNLSVCAMPSVALIGTCQPTSEGSKMGYQLGKKLTESGFNVVSGLAYGCDKSGHEGALSTQGGVTTAFLAHGLDTVYPSEHKYLAEAIVANGGLLMSEYECGTHCMPSYFVARDRLQSGLSDACIVIQTGRTGGTLHAARATLANNKPLFAVQYSHHLMNAPKVQGNKMLIEEGLLIDYQQKYKKATPLTTTNIDEVIVSLCPTHEV